MKKIEQEAKLKDWSPFYYYLDNLLLDAGKKRKAETNPYRQLKFDEQKKTIKTTKRLYETYLKTGVGIDLASNAYGDHLGRGYSKTLETLLQTLERDAKTQKHNYMAAAYRLKVATMKQIINEFNKFIKV